MFHFEITFMSKLFESGNLLIDLRKRAMDELTIVVPRHGRPLFSLFHFYLFKYSQQIRSYVDTAAFIFAYQCKEIQYAYPWTYFSK